MLKEAKAALAKLREIFAKLQALANDTDTKTAAITGDRLLSEEGKKENLNRIREAAAPQAVALMAESRAVAGPFLAQVDRLTDKAAALRAAALELEAIPTVKPVDLRNLVGSTETTLAASYNGLLALVNALAVDLLPAARAVRLSQLRPEELKDDIDSAIEARDRGRVFILLREADRRELADREQLKIRAFNEIPFLDLEEMELSLDVMAKLGTACEALHGRVASGATSSDAENLVNFAEGRLVNFLTAQLAEEEVAALFANVARKSDLLSDVLKAKYIKTRGQEAYLSLPA